MSLIERAHHIPVHQQRLSSEPGGEILRSDEFIRLSHGQTLHLSTVQEVMLGENEEFPGTNIISSQVSANFATDPSAVSGIDVTRGISHSRSSDYGTMSTLVEVIELSQVRRVHSFGWGLRLLCIADALFICVCLLLPLPRDLRFLSSLFLWGPVVSFVGVSMCSARLTTFAILYHVGYVVGVAITEKGSGLWGGISAVFHTWASSLHVRFLLRLRLLSEPELILLKRLFRQIN